MQTSGGIGTRSRTAGEWLAAARRYEREGELFQAYDIAMQGLARFPRDLPLKHRAVSCLASIQATAQATELSEKLGLNLAESQIASCRRRCEWTFRASGRGCARMPRSMKRATRGAPGSARRPCS